jgi:outer membrane lipoprotein carrier protein
MKRIITAFFALLVISAGAQAQNNTAKAKEILDKVGAKYKGYSTLKADFKYTLEIQSEKFKEEQKGTLYLKKAKFRLEMPDQVVICDNKSIWTYLKDANEVQINDYDAKAMDVNPSEIFTMYEKGYLYTYSGEETINKKVYHLIELTPTDKKQNVFKVKLYVDKANNTLFRSKLFEKSGNIYTYEILSQEPNLKLDDAVYFSFDKTKYPKVTVVDLRTGKGK